MLERPVIAITMGDAAGIGPEITLKALTDAALYASARPLVIGSRAVLEDIRQRLSIPVSIHAVTQPNEALYTAGTVDVVDLDNIDVASLALGQVQAQCGQAAFDYVKRSVELAQAGQVDAIVTAPINKEALRAAGVPYIGHTEMFADLQHVENEMTMFLIENVRIFFLTRHVPLIEACRQIANPDFVHAGIVRAYRALTTLAGEKPRLAVAGLNPHSGEGGLLGREEVESIRPAIERALAQGMNVVGPVPADSVFHFARQGQYDAVLSLYHDQGHIAAKVMDFEKTVSITLGLPTLRTSVDHGTAFDIAGKGVASAVSMVEAIRAAIRYAPKYQPV
ncbi:4-hydroxythreonine-4-phosphate dehydrogenase PdxA [Alicyclobacillus herbarius]|uniref:4-hydroxythreonine-4-phosphate dehydrogenase PdxA n=1 Tax=Alicyclobacillus herbarius TaxID=122960 RepID=UPI00041168AF|nr:4-hydroxythreonine-4-phosphate dehydrogenase PdxA [Alicyclobacillus herbarius]